MDDTMMNPGMPGDGGAHAAQQAQVEEQRRQEEERRRHQEEEEVMTGYRPDELAGDWQFKIVKGSFKTAKQVQEVQHEMAEWGWVLLEVFDESRIRFKRPASAAARDAEREGNPFRTVSKTSGPGCGSMV